MDAWSDCIKIRKYNLQSETIIIEDERLAILCCKLKEMPMISSSPAQPEESQNQEE